MTDGETAAAMEQQVARLDARLSELEDERSIRDVIAEYGYVSDFGSIDDFVALFTPDGALDISMGASYGEFATTMRWEGSKQLHDFLADPEGLWDKSWYRNVMHVQGNNLKIAVDGNDAVASGYALSLRSADSELKLVGASANRWVLEKHDGRWLIRERTLRAVGHDEFAAMVRGPGAVADAGRSS